MKVAIIGGGGRVGSCAAFALQCSGIVKEIIVLDAGVIVERGTHAGLLAQQGRYADMWALQQSAD